MHTRANSKLLTALTWQGLMLLSLSRKPHTLTAKLWKGEKVHTGGSSFQECHDFPSHYCMLLLTLIISCIRHLSKSIPFWEKRINNWMLTVPACFVASFLSCTWQLCHFWFAIANPSLCWHNVTFWEDRKINRKALILNAALGWY